MHVGVEEAVAEHLLEEALGRAREDLVGIEARRDQRGALVGGDPADPLERQHPARGALPVDPRHAEALVAREVLGELGGGGRLEAQVHLEPGPEREGLDHLDRLEAAEAGLEALDPGRDPGEEVDVAHHLALDAGPQDLDRDLLARGGDAEVHLGDRGRGDRPVVEAREQLGERPAELALDQLAGERAVERRQVVLQLREIGGELLAEQVGAGREALAELDEARARAPAARAARRWPGRPGASWRDSRRARRRTTSGSGRSSSGNSALWRARQRPMPTRRQRWRLERSMR